MSTDIQKLTEALKADFSYVRQSIEWNQLFNAEMERKRETTFGDFGRWLLLTANTAFSFYVTYQDGKQLLAALEARRRLEARPKVKAVKPSFTFGALTEPVKPAQPLFALRGLAQPAKTNPTAKRRGRARQ
jgi:hypothetical protein